MASFIHKELSDKVLWAAFTVHNALGPGLLESAYEEALCVELAHLGLAFERQQVFPLAYRGEYVGAYIADLAVENTIILELKSCRVLSPAMVAQIINYLYLSGLLFGFLLYFYGTRMEWKRFFSGVPTG